MHSVEVAIHKRYCGTCHGEIKKGAAHIVYGSAKMRVGRRNLCIPCACLLILEAISIEEKCEVKG